MCIEFAFKRGGITLIRNFIHSAEGVKNGLPTAVQNRLSINYKIRTYTQGKVTDVRFITDPVAGYQAKGDKK
ncbi:unnamed protein product [Paramecium octaurelia]|uniref:Uncharacterized protein n=1 Tax=Paramecium octaurelia TaxID=43137 RepID=A0A8S1UMF0_PAROT|nr:unnamed protein product [Paramecium octaurelia]CAD8180982.1 unnamed protein product [Paramecium octaurelia]